MTCYGVDALEAIAPSLKGCLAEALPNLHRAGAAAAPSVHREGCPPPPGPAGGATHQVRRLAAAQPSRSIVIIAAMPSESKSDSEDEKGGEGKGEGKASGERTMGRVCSDDDYDTSSSSYDDVVRIRLGELAVVQRRTARGATRFWMGMGTRWSSRSIVERVTASSFAPEFHKIRRLDCGGGGK